MAALLQFLTIFLSTLGVVLLATALGNNLLANRVRQRLIARLQSGATTHPVKLTKLRNAERNASAVVSALSRLSVSQSSLHNSALQLRFVRAGFRHPNAPRIYFAIKTALALASLLIVTLLMPLLSPHASMAKWLITMLSTALLTNLLPDFFLNVRTKDRAQKMQDALPDIIDLLVICTESGLGMDAAISKVARDMARSSPELAEEFYIMGLAIRAGEARMSALRNLALRVNLEDLNDLASMLIQADRFGTSLAESLRIQSEVMRGKRLQRAEEMAAKIPTKMLLPLIGFIFPVLLIVLLGPAAMQIGKVFAA